MTKPKQIWAIPAGRALEEQPPPACGSVATRRACSPSIAGLTPRLESEPPRGSVAWTRLRSAWKGSRHLRVTRGRLAKRPWTASGTVLATLRMR